MTILNVATEAAKKIGLDVPDALLSSTDREAVELLSVIKEMGQRILDGHDWQVVKKLATITGDGSTTAWELEADYHRMTKKARLWTSALETPLTHVIDEDEWLEMETRSYDYVVNAWIMYNNQIHIKPALASAVTVQYFYIGNRVWTDSTSDPGTYVSSPGVDNDEYRISEELLKLGTIYRWKQLKRQPYAEEMADYEDLKDRLITADGGAKRIKIGRARMPAGTSVAYPENLGSP